MILLHAGIALFHLSNMDQLHTFTFQMLIYVELFDVLIVRERNHFWNSKPSRFLLLAIGVDLVLVFFISVLGLPGVMPIEPIAALALTLVIPVISFLLNDPIKVFLIRRFWRKGRSSVLKGKPAIGVHSCSA